MIAPCKVRKQFLGEGKVPIPRIVNMKDRKKSQLKAALLAKILETML